MPAESVAILEIPALGGQMAGEVLALAGTSLGSVLGLPLLALTALAAQRVA